MIPNTSFLSPCCPICGDRVSGIVGDVDRVYCFECKVKFELEMVSP